MMEIRKQKLVTPKIQENGQTVIFSKKWPMVKKGGNAYKSY